MTTSTAPASVRGLDPRQASSAAHVLVVRDDTTDLQHAIGPFPGVTEASIHAYRSCGHLDDKDVQFLTLTSRRGEIVPAHHIHAANAIFPGSLPNDSIEVAQVVVGIHQGVRRAFGPFANADEAGHWITEFQEHLDASPDVIDLSGRDGKSQPGREWAGVLESLVTVDIALRATVTGKYGMHFNEVNEPECRNCEYMPLIGFYGHVCGSDYVEY